MTLADLIDQRATRIVELLSTLPAAEQDAVLVAVHGRLANIRRRAAHPAPADLWRVPVSDPVPECPDERDAATAVRAAAAEAVGGREKA